MNMKKRKNFAQVANAIIRNKDLSDGAFRVFCELLSHRYNNGRVFPSHNTMAKDIGVDVRTIRNHIKQLKILGLVSWKKRGFSKSNEYIINDEKYFTNEYINAEDSFILNRKKISQNIGKNFQTNNIKEENKKNNKSWKEISEEIRRKIK